jgi:phage major head subunit gpT-like protein
MAGIINTGSFPKALWPGVKKWYGDAYEDHTVEYDKLFEKYSSDKAWEEFVGKVGLGYAVVKAEGAPITYDSEQQGFTTRVQHVNYGLGFIITQEMMDDDQYMIVGERRSKDLARSMRLTKEVNAANLYNRAFNAAFTFGDGKEMISSAHPNVSGGTWSNKPSVDADLSEASLEQAVIDLEGYQDDRGLLIAVKPKSLIIPRQLMFEAQRILKADGRVGTDNNDPNVLKMLGSIPTVVVNHYLTDTDAWFIRTNVEGLAYVERKADTFAQDNDFDTENAKFKAQGRYSFTCFDPRSIYGCAGV